MNYAKKIFLGFIFVIVAVFVVCLVGSFFSDPAVFGDQWTFLSKSYREHWFWWLEPALIASAVSAAAWAAVEALKTNELTKAVETPTLVALPPTKKFTCIDGFPEENRIFFVFKNVGRSTATITSVVRKCEVLPKKGSLTALDPKGHDNTVKETVISVGGQSESYPIWTGIRRAYVACFNKGDWIVFHGYVTYKDALERTYVHGFAFFNDLDGSNEGVFAYYWPSADIERYHYVRQI